MEGARFETSKYAQQQEAAPLAVQRKFTQR